MCTYCVCYTCEVRLPPVIFVWCCVLMRPQEHELLVVLHGPLQISQRARRHWPRPGLCPGGLQRGASTSRHRVLQWVTNTGHECVASLESPSNVPSTWKRLHVMVSGSCWKLLQFCWPLFDRWTRCSLQAGRTRTSLHGVRWVVSWTVECTRCVPFTCEAYHRSTS